MNKFIYTLLAAIVLAGLSFVLYQQHKLDTQRIKTLDDRVTELSSSVNVAKQQITQLSAEQSRLNQIAAQQAANEQQAGQKHKVAAEGVRNDYKNDAPALASRSVPDSVVSSLRAAAVDAEAAGVVTGPEHPRVYDDELPGSGNPGGGDGGKADVDRAGGSQLAGDLQRQDEGNP